MAWRLLAALESAFALHVYALRVCALCLIFQGLVYHLLESRNFQELSGVNPRPHN